MSNLAKGLPKAGLLSFLILVFFAAGTRSSVWADPDTTGIKQPLGQIASDVSAWEHWKTEDGFSLDKRLEIPVAIWEEKLSIADILARLSEKSGVSLQALESQLQAQELTVLVKDLPLKSFMHQLSELLGVFWYQREGETGGLEYLATYGSESAQLKGEYEIEARDFSEQERRALRIADYLEALSMTEPELMARAREDPMLAGTMMKNPAGRYMVEILAEMPPGKLRQFINDGHIILSLEELPKWAEDNLRENFKTSKFKPQEISQDKYLEQFRLILSDAGKLTPEDGLLYELIGGEWQGFSYGSVRLASIEENFEIETNTDWYPTNAVPLFDLPFLSQEISQHRLVKSRSLPGKGDDRMVRQTYPELIGEEASPGYFFYENLRERSEEYNAKLKVSPWKDDPQLSQPPQFSLSSKKSHNRAVPILQNIAEQTGYNLLATYYESKDTPILNLKSEEPLYLLLNRASQYSNCTWQFTRPVILWRHNDWFVLETKRATASRPSLP